MSYEAGKKAALEGKTLADNPHFTGEFTKLGTPKMTEEGHDWVSGFSSVGRVASKAEMRAAANVDVSRFRKRSNKYYR